jgi:hypothetical protein
MSDEKKPKIDLKARLGKTAGPTAGGSMPVPAGSVPAPQGSVPAPYAGSVPAPFNPGGIPAPSIPPSATSSAAVDALGGLGMNMNSPFRQAAPHAPPPPQRIEVDESTLQEARRGAFKKASFVGIGAALAFGLVGYVAGGALEKGANRKRAMEDAAGLQKNVEDSKVTLEKLLKKLEEGKAGIEAKKFPPTLVADLAAITVDFDGSKLAGVRFSGFKASTTRSLIAYASSVQELNTKKTLVASLIGSLQKPMTESWAQTDKVSVKFVVLIGGPASKDPAGNPVAILAPLAKAVETTKAKFEMPEKYTVTFMGANREVERYKTGTLEKASGLAVLPNSIETAFPSETTGQKVRMLSQLASLMQDIKGEEAAKDKGKDDMERDLKAGLMTKADALVKELVETQKQ